MAASCAATRRVGDFNGDVLHRYIRARNRLRGHKARETYEHGIGLRRQICAAFLFLLRECVQHHLACIILGIRVAGHQGEYVFMRRNLDRHRFARDLDIGRQAGQPDALVQRHLAHGAARLVAFRCRHGDGHLVAPAIGGRREDPCRDKAEQRQHRADPVGHFEFV